MGIEITPGHIGAMFDERAIRHAFHHDHMLGGERFEPVAHPHMQKQLVVFAQEIATGLDHAAVRAHDDDLVGLEFAYDVGRVRGEDLLARPLLEQSRQISLARRMQMRFGLIDTDDMHVLVEQIIQGNGVDRPQASRLLP